MFSKRPWTPDPQSDELEHVTSRRPETVCSVGYVWILLVSSVCCVNTLIAAPEDTAVDRVNAESPYNI